MSQIEQQLKVKIEKHPESKTKECGKFQLYLKRSEK